MNKLFISALIFLSLFVTSLASSETRFIIDSNRQYPVVVAENDENGVLLNTYAYGVGLLPLSRTNVQTGETFSYITDQMKVLMVTDSEGNVVAEYQYDAYGNPMLLSGPESRLEDFIFGGNTFDPSSGFYNARARDYDPKIGRFTQMDTYQGNIQNPATLHKYTYAHNDPVNNIDPSGKFLAGLGATMNIAGVMATLAIPAYMIGQGLANGEYEDRDLKSFTNTEQGMLILMSMVGHNSSLFNLVGARSIEDEDHNCTLQGAAIRSEHDAYSMVTYKCMSFPSWPIRRFIPSVVAFKAPRKAPCAPGFPDDMMPKTIKEGLNGGAWKECHFRY